MSSGASDITQLLKQWNAGDKEAIDRLMPVVVDELRKIARAHLGKERAEHTLQPTALVNEAYMKLIDRDRVDWSDRVHFFAFASTVMRRILVDHARGKARGKRGGGVKNLSLDEALGRAEERDIDLIALDFALDKLAKLDERQARVVELKFFGGLSSEEIAEVLDIGVATVGRSWRVARAFLARELQGA